MCAVHIAIMDSVKRDQDIVVQIAKNFDSPNVCFTKLKKLVKAVCNRFNPCEARATLVSITLVDDAEIRKLNKKFLNRKSGTDCLSFDLSDDDTHSPRVFELVVNAEIAAKEANLRGHSNEAELALYITHGLLHNLGFDDSTQQQAKKMHETEDKILKQFGYGLVYNKSKRVSNIER